MPVCVEVRAELPPGVVIVVEKSARRMGVYEAGALRRTDAGPACFAVALGGSPVGDKERRGDERTPEGAFRVTHQNPSSAFHLSLGLNYPTARHAEAAWARGTLHRATRDRIVAADRPGRMPVRDSALGGDIYLHGGGSQPPGWTDGCVAIADAEMDWLFAVATPGTAVWILP